MAGWNLRLIAQSLIKEKEKKHKWKYYLVEITAGE